MRDGKKGTVLVLGLTFKEDVPDLRNSKVADLVAALESGQLAGAGLDVTDPEPLTADHPLWQMPNVIITPHVSWAGSDRRYHNTLLRENIRRYLAGEALLNVVDPERGY